MITNPCFDIENFTDAATPHDSLIQLTLKMPGRPNKTKTTPNYFSKLEKTPRTDQPTTSKTFYPEVKETFETEEETDSKDYVNPQI